MNYKENIRYRETIMKKAYAGEKWTKEEREWSLSNPLYNPKYEYEVLQKDIINLAPKQEYEVKVKIKTLNYHDGMFIPVIGVATGKGYIKTDLQLLDIDGKEVDYQKTKILGLMINDKDSEATSTFSSDTGLMSVGYECDYYNSRSKIHVRAGSNANYAFGMIKVQISDNEVEYRCKLPFELKSPFDAMIFTVKWMPI